MPANNRFRHQTYPSQTSQRPILRRIRRTPRGQADLTRLHETHEIHNVLLVHGTFLGDDPFGVSDILRQVASSAGRLGRHIERLADELAAATKAATAALAKDVGNYTDDYAARIGALAGDGVTAEPLSPTWSGQNHHVARADLAMRLIVRLDELVDSDDQRVLLWGHSHAGNGFALLTNLLANDRDAVNTFFRVADQRNPIWEKARSLLANVSGPHPLAKAIDIVTFGTPVRYGWDTNGCRRLLHILHHREPDQRHPGRTRPLFPPHSLRDTLTARYGDWVQAFAIAGTDVPAATAIIAHKRLDAFLTRGLPPPDHGLDTRLIVPEYVRDACARWKAGTRCHADGLNILLDYEPCGRKTRVGQPVEESLLGHGVATTIDWLPNHLDLVVQALDDKL